MKFSKHVIQLNQNGIGLFFSLLAILRMPKAPSEDLGAETDFTCYAVYFPPPVPAKAEFIFILQSTS